MSEIKQWLPATPALGGSGTALGFLTGVRQIRAAADRIYPPRSWTGRRKHLKFILRAIWQWPLTLRWLDQMASSPPAGLADANPRIYEKLQRPYLHKRYRPAERLRTLEFHYGFLKQAFGDAATSALHGSARQVAVLSLARQPVSFTLGCEPQFEKEGELTLSLRSTEGRRLMSLTFCIGTARDGAPAILIGCLQGTHFAEDPEMPRRLTRDMHGLRPRNALVVAAQMLAGRFGVERIRAVSDAAHIYQHPRYWLSSKPSARNDGLWQEIGGVRSADGYWDLPPSPARRESAEIRPNKRAMYARRYAMLDELARAFTAAVP